MHRSGYLYTTRIIDKAGGKDKLGENAISGFLATYQALNGSGVAPVNSSGWFLPSMGQLAESLRERKSLSAAALSGHPTPPLTPGRPIACIFGSAMIVTTINIWRNWNIELNLHHFLMEV